METNTISFKLDEEYGFYSLTICINGNTICSLEFLDLFETLYRLSEIGHQLQLEPLKQVHYLTLDSIYNCEYTLKISPYPPLDWLVFGIDKGGQKSNYFLDRLDFCHQLKSEIQRYLKSINMDYLGSQLPTTEHYDHQWKVLSHQWFDD